MNDKTVTSILNQLSFDIKNNADLEGFGG